jgi:hypothetical protein
MPTQDYQVKDRIETRIQFRAGGQLFAFLGLRSLRMGTPSPDLQARAEIEIWREVMTAELRRIPLTLAEASCLADVLKGHRPSRGPVSASIGICYAECEQAFRLAQEIADQTPAGPWWGVREEVLLAKLQRLGPAADLALEDAIARWHDHHFDATLEGFERAGLRMIPDRPSEPR